MSKAVTSVRKIIRSAESNMLSEGFTVTRRAKRDGRRIIKGDVSATKVVGKYILKHSGKSYR